MVGRTPQPLNPWSSEQVITCADETVGLRAVIAIDDTSLGPGLGGVRFSEYPDASAALIEAQRLARAMTFKHALADLPYGGAKAVIVTDGPAPAGADRERVFTRFGEFVKRVGVFIPGIDMGTTRADMVTMRAAGAKVYSADFDPSPWGARGAYAALRAGAVHALGTDDLRDVRVAVQGVGHVGAALARLLAADGARVLVGDIDHDAAQRLADQIGGLVIDPADAPYAVCDIFSPCAVPQVLRADSVGRLQCRLVAGVAADIFDDDTTADALHAAGVTVVPDYIVNAGSVIHEHARAMGWDEERLSKDVDRIGARVADLLEESARVDEAPTRVAQRRARERLTQEL